MKVEYYRYPVFGALFTGCVMLMAFIALKMLESHPSVEASALLFGIIAGILIFMRHLVRWGFAYELSSWKIRIQYVRSKEKSFVSAELSFAGKRRAVKAYRRSEASSGLVTFVQAYFQLLNEEIQDSLLGRSTV